MSGESITRALIAVALMLSWGALTPGTAGALTTTTPALDFGLQVTGSSTGKPAVFHGNGFHTTSQCGFNTCTTFFHDIVGVATITGDTDQFAIDRDDCANLRLEDQE